MRINDEAHLEGHDIIGDVHGCHDALVALLERMDYRRDDGVFHCPGRKVVFLGDMIDRGPSIPATLRLVREMVEAGSAHCLLGNHEFHAIAHGADRWDTHDRSLGHTLRQFRARPTEWRETLAWMKRQPLCLEFPHFRAVHACWDDLRVARLRALNPACTLEDAGFTQRAMTRATEESGIVSRLLSGVSLDLPPGQSIRGTDGVERTRFRSAFWHPEPRTWGDVAFQPGGLPATLAARELNAAERARLPHYASREKPLFVGHYWRSGTPALLTPNIACLDYSAVRAGLLVAYRMGREPMLDPQCFTWVKVDQAH